MLTKHLLIVLSFFAAMALAQTGSTPPPASPEEALESAGRVETGMFIPEELRKGSFHSVGEIAETDGLLNTSFLDSGERDVEVTTGIALRARIREIYAFNKLRGMSKTDEFGKAKANAGKQKLKAVGGIVRDPVGTD
jgi:hypothetical protein